jgi:hypothetical protein
LHDKDKDKETLGSFRPSFSQGKLKKKDEEFLRFYMLIMDILYVVEGHI